MNDAYVCAVPYTYVSCNQNHFSFCWLYCCCFRWSVRLCSALFTVHHINNCQCMMMMAMMMIHMKQNTDDRVLWSIWDIVNGWVSVAYDCVQAIYSFTFRPLWFFISILIAILYQMYMQCTQCPFTISSTVIYYYK